MSKRNMPESKEGEQVSEEDGPVINNNVIRIQLRKPRNRKWELVTRNSSPGRVFPTIQLFDCEGNLLLETNDDNISIKSTDVEKHPGKRHSKSLGATDFAKRQINFPVKKTNSVTGDKVYTRFYRRCNSKPDEQSSQGEEGFDNPDNDACIQNDKVIAASLKIPAYGRSLSSPISVYSSGLSGLETSEIENSSYKSSDNESCSPLPAYKYVSGKAGTLLLYDEDEINNPNRRKRPMRRNSTNPQFGAGSQHSINRLQGNDDSRSNEAQRKLFTYNGMPITPPETFENTMSNNIEDMPNKICKSASYHKPKCKRSMRAIRRANTDINTALKSKYISTGDSAMVREMSFLDIYLKSLPSRNKSSPSWLDEITSSVKLRKEAKNLVNETWRRGIVITDDSTFTFDPDFLYDDDVDSAVENEIRRRLKKYQKVTSCSDYWAWKKDIHRRELKRRYSEGALSSSSESVDEADKVLMRLRRRIFQNKKRERKASKNGKRT